MLDPIFIATIGNLIATSASSWLAILRDTLFSKGIEVIPGRVSDFLHLDEKEQLKHLREAMAHATEKGLIRCHTLEEKELYSHIIHILLESGDHNETLRREAMSIFTLSDTPNLVELNKAYNRALRIDHLTQPAPPPEVNAAPYLQHFFDALLAEIYADPVLKPNLCDALATRANLTIMQSLPQLVTAISEMRTIQAEDYPSEQLKQDVQIYAGYIRKIYQRLKIVGIDSPELNIDPELDNIFVPLHVKINDRSLPSTKISDQASLPDKVNDRQIPEEKKVKTISEALKDHDRIVLLGGPGLGKSTVTQHLAWSHADAYLRAVSTSLDPLLTGCLLPIRIELRNLTEERQYDNYSILSYVEKVTLERACINSINKQMFEELLKRGVVLLLFDGLDEVATLEKRRSLVEEIEHFALNYPGNRILVTSRLVGYESVRFSQEFVRVDVQEFNNSQIREFLERWYTYVLQLSPIPHDDQQNLEELFQILQENQRLHQLATNPLLLTLIAALHRCERLPDRQVEIYKRCVQLLLEGWSKLKGTHSRWRYLEISTIDRYACVAHLGFVLHKHSQERQKSTAGIDSLTENAAGDVSSHFMRQEIERFLRENHLFIEVAKQHSEADLFFDFVKVEAGLIVKHGKDEQGEDLYGFVHRTFQEYCAAADVYERYLQKGNSSRIVSQFLKKYLHDPHWHVVTILLLSKLVRQPVTNQLRQIFEGQLISQRSKYTDTLQQDFFFICMCLQEEILVEEEFVEAVITHLGSIIRQSPLPSLQQHALYRLGKLCKTHMHTKKAQKELIYLAMDESLDMEKRINTVWRLYKSTLPDSFGYQQAIKLLLNLKQLPNLPAKDLLQATQTLCNAFNGLDNLPLSDELQQGIQMLQKIAQKPAGLTPDQQIRVVGKLYRLLSWFSEEPSWVFQMLVRLIKDSHLPIEQRIRAMSYLRETGSSFSWQLRPVYQRWFELAQSPDLPIEQQIEMIQEFIRLSAVKGEKQQQLSQKIVDLFQRSDHPIEQQIQALAVFCEFKFAAPDERRKARMKLLQFVQQADLTIEQRLAAADALPFVDPLEQMQPVYQVFWSLLCSSELSIAQQSEIIEMLVASSSSLAEVQQLSSRLLLLAKRTHLTVDDQLSIARHFWFLEPSSREEELRIVQILSQYRVYEKVVGKQAKRWYPHL